ncbi:MAG: hypothetical protein IPH03_08625 [Tetrasphaera sp.]|nr:hypothetical protein [Tetrasphaera sp.]
MRVHNLRPRAQWGRRPRQINTWERRSPPRAPRSSKSCCISRDEQKARLAERLANPEKHWKFMGGDLDERALWDDYQSACRSPSRECSADVAPWYVVP